MADDNITIEDIRGDPGFSALSMAEKNRVLMQSPEFRSFSPQDRVQLLSTYHYGELPPPPGEFLGYGHGLGSNLEQTLQKGGRMLRESISGLATAPFAMAYRLGQGIPGALQTYQEIRQRPEQVVPFAGPLLTPILRPEERTPEGWQRGLMGTASQVIGGALAGAPESAEARPAISPEGPSPPGAPGYLSSAARWGARQIAPVRTFSDAELMTKALQPPSAKVGELREGPVGDLTGRMQAKFETAVDSLRKWQNENDVSITDRNNLNSAVTRDKTATWKTYDEKYRTPIAQDVEPGSGNLVRDRMLSSIDPRMREQMPEGEWNEFVRKANSYADRDLTFGQIEDRVQSVNKELSPLHRKTFEGQYEATDASSIVRLQAESDALHDILYAKLNRTYGPAAVAMRQEYGALAEIEPLTMKVAGQAAKEIPTPILSKLTAPAKAVGAWLQRAQIGPDAMIKQVFGRFVPPKELPAYPQPGIIGRGQAQLPFPGELGQVSAVPPQQPALIDLQRSLEQKPAPLPQPTLSDLLKPGPQRQPTLSDLLGWIRRY